MSVYGVLCSIPRLLGGLVLHNLPAIALRMCSISPLDCFVLGVSSDCSLSFCPSESPGMAFFTISVEQRRSCHGS